MAADAQKDLRTIFVRGVSFDAGEKELESVCSDVGPVKKCFLVRVFGQPKHRGFGFVQFALAEDAERAAEELNGKELKGRKLQVEIANKRAPMEERKKKRKGGEGEAGAEGQAGGEAEPDANADAAHKDKKQKPVPAAAAKPAAAAAAAAAPAPAAKAKPAAAPPAAAPKHAPALGAGADATAGAAPAPGQAQGRPQGRAAGRAAGRGEGEDKHRLVRAVAVGNLTPAAVAQAVALARKVGPVEEVMDPAPQDIVQRAKLEADGCSGLAIIIVYKTVKDAMEAVTKLHGQKLVVRPAQPVGGPGGKKGKKGKKGEPQADAAEAGAGGDAAAGTEPQSLTLWAREVKGEGAHVKQWRLILRNLPFKITEQALHKALDPVAFVWELKLPRKPDGRLQGFAFASFTRRADAEKAIAALNGKDLSGRMVVADWAVAKSQYQAQALAQEEAKKEGKEDEGADGMEEDDGEGESEGEGEEELGSEGDSEGDDGEEGEDEEEEIGMSSDDEDGGSLDEDEDDDEDEEEDEDGESEEGEEEGEEGAAAEAEEEGADADARREHRMLSSVLASVMGQEGEVEEPGAKDKADRAAREEQGKAGREAQERREARQGQAQEGRAAARHEWQGEEAQDPDAEAAGRSRPGSTSGPAPSLDTTVFVRGLPLDATGQQLQARLELFGAIRACRLVMDKASGKPRGTAFVEFRQPEAAAQAAEACARGRRNEGPGITLAGQPLEVDVALSGEGARSLATERVAGKAAAKDKRNLYLAKEGALTEGSPAWRAMSAHDQAKRKRAAEEKNTKLRSPNFVISATRLSVRNIPPTCTEAQLKRLFVDAVRERATKERPRVVQCKILKEEGQYDAKGARKSKGLGFVEFERHDHALTALRQLNNNPGTAWGRERRPIIEFAIDNVKVLKKIEHLKAKFEAKQQREQQEQQQGGESGAAADGQQQAEERGKGKEGGKGGAGKEEGAAAGKKRRTATEGGAADGGAEGGGSGELTKRQRKRLKQKSAKAVAAVRRQDALEAREGGDRPPRRERERDAKEGGGAGAAGRGQDRRPPPQPRGPGGKPGPGQQAQQPRGQQRERPRQGRGEAAGGGGDEERAQRQKRRAEEGELDRIAAAGLREDGAAARKRRRRSDNPEEGGARGGDRLDRLAAAYKARLEGGAKGAAKGLAAEGKGGQQEKGKQGGKAQQQRKQQGGKQGGKGGEGGAAAVAGLADLVKGAAAGGGGLRRWFD